MKTKRSIDPSRTVLLRRQFGADMKRRFRRIEKAVKDLFLKEDVLGWKERKEGFTGNIDTNTFRFATSSAKVAMFRRWLKKMVDDGILSVSGGGIKGRPWTAKYVESAYRKGLVRSYTESHKKELSGVKWLGGAKAQFLRDAFASPVLMSQVELLATRTLNLLQGVTDQMSNQMSLILAEGLAHGHHPTKIASRMVQSVGGLTRNRALVISRTEIIHAHAEGQLDGFEILGIEEVMAEVELKTAGDSIVCSICRSLEGKRYTIDNARGVIPVHPNCFLSPLVPIYTSKGWVPMGKICVGDFVYTHIGGCEKVVQLHKTKSNGKVNAVQLKAKTAKRAITITENHPVWTNKGWVEAGKLKIGDFVGGLFFGNMLELHPIVSIRKYKTKVPYLYNLSVEKDESYIANGYVVHNCRCAWNGVIPEKMMKGVK